MDSKCRFLYNHLHASVLKSTAGRSAALDYLCVFDMDGTLLNTDQSVSEKNREALSALRRRDVGVILATGRSELMTRKYVRDLGLDLPIISNNGSLVMDTRTHEVLYKNTFTRPVLKKLLEYTVGNDKDYFIYTVDKVYYSANSKKIKIMHHYNSMVPEEEKITIVKLPGNVDAVIASLPDGGEQSAVKILLSYQTAEDYAYFSTVDEAESIASQADSFDIMPVGCTKGKALEFLAGYLGILRENIFAFGDNCNDVPMLEYAAYAIVPANGAQEAKAIADFITASNDDAGVAKGIYEFVIPKIV